MCIVLQKRKKRQTWSQFGSMAFAGERRVKLMPEISLYVFLGWGWGGGLGGWCERSCGGMRQRGYQFVEGFLCPISSVKGHVPRVLTLVTSLASSLPGDLGPGVFITTPFLTSPKHSSPHGGKQNTSIPPPQPFLGLGTCTNWMHIHTLMHDDPSVDLCLGVKHS